jgi:hypothetical protein
MANEWKGKSVSAKYLKQLLVQHKGSETAAADIIDTLIAGGYYAPRNWKERGLTVGDNATPERRFSIAMQAVRRETVKKMVEAGLEEADARSKVAASVALNPAGESSGGGGGSRERVEFLDLCD